LAWYQCLAFAALILPAPGVPPGIRKAAPPASVRIFEQLAAPDDSEEYSNLGPFVLWALGNPEASFDLGSVEHWQYRRYGIEFLFNDRDAKAQLRFIPPAIDPALPNAIKHELKALQGVWELTAVEGRPGLVGHAPVRSYLQFEGTHLVFAGAGVAPRVCYKVDPTTSPRAIDLFLPDPADDALWSRDAEGLPRYGIYVLSGDRLRLRFGRKARPKDFQGLKTALPTWELRRVDSPAP
jgi:uncharacterized protein (TIGR03067 family)